MKPARRQPQYPLPPIRILSIARDGYQQYKATIDQYAEVKWDGINMVAVEGRRLWALPPVKLELLRQALEKYDFLNLYNPDEWSILQPISCPSNGSYTITAVFMDGSAKTIDYNLDRSDLPRKLFQLERRLETILGVRKWAGPAPLIE